MYALVDCNSFYAKCEEAFRPDLWGKPVIVLSNNDGCIVSRNAEAKALNIPDLVAFFEVKDIVEKNNVHVFSSNYELYGDMSSRVMKTLADFEGDLDIYSIDEAFLKIYKKTDYKPLGYEIKSTIQQHVGLPVCVGFAPTKTLAKLANKVAKKKAKLGGVCVLDTKEKWEWVLARCSPRLIWGIGGQTAKRLAEMGIHTALQFARSDPKYLRRNFSVVQERIHSELNGIACIPLELEPSPKKEIINSRSFGKKITDKGELEEAICQYAGRACEKLRKQNGLTKTIWVFAETSRFIKDPYARQKVIQLPQYTNDTREISYYAKQAVDDLYRPGLLFHKAGVGLLDLTNRKFEQLHFFTPHQPEKSRALMTVMDGLNKKYGSGTVGLANAGIEQKWKMQRHLKSPSYTTRWSELLSAT